MMSAQEETDLLLRTAKDVAQKQLQRGSFLSFAVTLGPTRNANVMFTEDVRRETSRVETEQYWAGELRNVAAQGEIRALCYGRIVRVAVAEGGTAAGILIHLEQAEGAAEDVFFPCRKDQSGNIVMEEPGKNPSVSAIFAELRAK